MKKFLLALAIFSLSFSILTPFAPAQANTTRSILDNIVIVTSPDNDVYGTGFFISPYGHILTNEHVIHDGKLFQLCYRLLNEAGIACYDSDKLKVLAKDSNLDLALLQLPQIPNAYNNNYLILGDSNSAKVGDEINVLGYPQDDLLSLDLTKGLISEISSAYILTDAQILHGNSGSPVLNGKNEVIGIAVATLGAEYGNAGVLISSNVAKDWLISIRFNPKSGINKLTKPKKTPVFISKDGGFSINFPGKPMFTSDIQVEEFGEITANIYLYKTKNNEILYAIYSSVTPEQLKQLFSIEYIKKNNQKDEVKNVFGTITDEEIKFIEDMDNKKIFYKGKSSKGFFLISEIYAVKNKYYEIGILKKDSYPDDKLINSFIKSFKLLSN